MDTYPFQQVTRRFQDGLPLEIMHIERHGDLGLHTHQFSELVIVLKGSGLHMTPAGDYPITAGDVFVLHGDQAHGYRDTAELELVNILFRMDELAIPMLDLTSSPGYHALFTLEPLFRQRDSFESRLRLTPEQLRNVTDLLRRLTMEYESTAPGKQIASLAYFMLIMTDLCRYYSRTETPGAQPLLRLGRVIGYIQEHFADQFSLDDLARIGCISRRTLTREFARAMDCSPMEYVIRLRINRAVDLLLGQGASITDIAFQVGYQDSNYFTRQFRATMGCNPREFRRRQLICRQPTPANPPP